MNSHESSWSVLGNGLGYAADLKRDVCSEAIVLKVLVDRRIGVLLESNLHFFRRANFTTQISDCSRHLIMHVD